MVVLELEALTPDERVAVLTGNGMSQGETDALLREAEMRGLTEFLNNPHNLLLLSQAVQSGAWPTKRRDCSRWLRGSCCRRRFRARSDGRRRLHG